MCMPPFPGSMEKAAGPNRHSKRGLGWLNPPGGLPFPEAHGHSKRGLGWPSPPRGLPFPEAHGHSKRGLGWPSPPGGLPFPEAHGHRHCSANTKTEAENPERAIRGCWKENSKSEQEACRSLVAWGLSEPDADLRAGVWGLGSSGRSCWPLVLSAVLMEVKKGCLHLWVRKPPLTCP